MGKASVIFVVGFAVVVGGLRYAGAKRAEQAYKQNFAYYDKTQADNISRSATNVYMHELRKNPDLKGDYTVNSILDGSATVSVNEVVPGNRDNLSIATVGAFGTMESDASVLAQSNATNGPKITGALGVSYLSKAKLKLGKDTEIDGNNYSITGTLDNSVHSIAGVSLGHPDQLLNLDYKLKEVKIKGKGLVDPNIEVQTPQPDYYDWAMKLAMNADVVYSSKDVKTVETLGTVNSPQVTYVKGNTKFNEEVTGAGILIVEGNLSLKKDFDFKGIVFVVGDDYDNVKVKSKSKASTNILGAMMVAGKKASVKTGDFDLKYSREAVNMALGIAGQKMSRVYTFSKRRTDAGAGYLTSSIRKLANGQGNNGKGRGGGGN